jgi:uncharacterized protein YijF (DUF1287 family)
VPTPRMQQVKAEDGFTYERKHVERWFKELDTQKRAIVSPITRKPIGRSLTEDIEMVCRFCTICADYSTADTLRYWDVELQVEVVQELKDRFTMWHQQLEGKTKDISETEVKGIDELGRHMCTYR